MLQHIPRWPFEPSFLSLRKGADETTENSNEDGLFYPDFIQGFLGSLANDEDINQPLTLYQFVPNGYEIEDDDTKEVILIQNDEIDSFIHDNKLLEGRKLIRLDSGKQFPTRKCCQIFRQDKEDNIKLCHVQDSRVALFANDKLSQIRNKSEFKSVLKGIVDDYNKSANLKEKYEVKVFLIENSSDDEFVYLRYRCKYSDFDEYVFPVFYGLKIVACLIQGQIVPIDFNKEIAFLDISSEENKNKIKKYLDTIKPCNNEEQRIRKIDKKIRTLEYRIANKVDLQKQNYINKIFAEVKTKFLENLSSIRVADTKALEQVKKHTSKALNEICEKFEFQHEFIEIFILAPQTLEKKFLLFATSNQNKLSDHYEFKFDFKEFWDSYFEKKGHLGLIDIQGESRKKIVKSFSCPEEIQDRDSLKLLPTLSNNVSFIIWKRSREWNSNREIRQVYNDRLTDFYILIAQIYATIVVSENEKTLTDTIRIAGHEVAQIIPAMLDFSETFQRLNASNVSDVIKSGKFHKALDDLKNQILLVRNIYDKPKLAFGLIPLQRDWVHLSDILAQGATLYRPLASDRNQQIPPPDEFANRISINVDDRYFGHIIYNLLDNAIKYSYEGTKIYIRAYIEDNSLIIGIVNYGKKIEQDEPIYDLYYRGLKQKYTTQGLGVGMFLSKKIALAHGFDLIHNSDLVSTYHLPVLRARYYDYFDLYSKIPISIFDEVVAANKDKAFLYKPGEEEAKLLLKEPTSRTEFKIIIPANYYKLLN